GTLESFGTRTGLKPSGMNLHIAQIAQNRILTILGHTAQAQPNYIQQKHAKCSGEVICERCTQRNLECTFIESSKKRGPKMSSNLPEQIYILNGSETNFNGTSKLSSLISNTIWIHASALSLRFGYLQQPDNIDELTLYLTLMKGKKSTLFK
ncbi:4394_t:CDS:2, partial [Dentiscutata erythropus]